MSAKPSSAKTVAYPSPIGRVIAAMEAAGCEPRSSGSGKYESRCPVHKGTRRNLSVSEGTDGTVLIRCHHVDESGQSCPTDAIVSTLGLKMADLFPAEWGPKGEKGKARTVVTPKRPPRGQFESPKVASEWIADKDKSTISGHWVYHDAAARAIFAVYRFDSAKGKTYRPISRDHDSGLWRIGGADDPLPLYRLPDLIEASRVFIFEGEKCVEIARPLGLVATTTAHGAGSVAKSDLGPLAGKELIICPDVGDSGRGYVAGLLRGLAELTPQPIVKILDLPGLLNDGDDIEQFMQARASKSPEEIRAEIEALLRTISPATLDPVPTTTILKVVGECPDDGEVLDIVGNHRQMPDITADALQSLAFQNTESPRYFRDGKELVRLRTRDHSKPEKELMTPEALRGMLARSARWFICDTKGKKRPGPPPKEIVADILSLPTWPEGSFLPLDIVTDVPVFDRHGNLVASEGYNRDSRAWYQPTPGLVVPPVPSRPTTDDIDRAKHWIFGELFGDFPFAESGSRAHAACAMIQPFVRSMILGPTPPNLVHAPVEGAGKGKLVDAAAVPANGRGVPPLSEVKDDDEWDKRITPLLLEDPPFILIDNVNHHLDSGALAKVFTAYPCHVGRILGTSRMVYPAVRCCWMLTANNPTISREIARRFVSIRLLPEQEKPWLRKSEEFRHPSLIPWAIENRGELVWAALVLVQAWIAAGQPRGQQTLGSYEGWAATMGGILDVAGVSGFLANQSDLYEVANDDVPAWRAFVAEWWIRFNGEVVNSASLLSLCEAQGLLVDALTGPTTDAGRKKRLGSMLKKMSGRCFGSYRLVKDRPDNSGTAQFRLVERLETEVIEA